MKQISLLLVAIVTIWGLSSCDNAQLGEMKAKQGRMVDSLANVQLADIKAQLMEDCNASVEEMIKSKVDSVQAIMASGGSSKNNFMPSSKPKPKPAAKPTPKPGTVTPNTGGDGSRDLKDRRRGNSTSPTGAGTMTNPDGSKAVPNTGNGRSLKDRRRGGN